MSHARAHYHHALAAQAGGTGPAQVIAASEYELMLFKLAEDRRRLKETQSIERKIELKRQMIPTYIPWVQGVVQSDSGRQDEVVMTLLVWLIDVGSNDAALDIAAYAIRHDLALPDRFERTLPCLLADEFSDATLKAIKADKGATWTNLDQLQTVEKLTSEHDMPDEVRAKLHKAQGYALRHLEGVGLDVLEQALPPARRLEILKQVRAHLLRAQELNDQAGVAKDLERLAPRIKALETNSAAPQEGNG